MFKRLVVVSLLCCAVSSNAATRWGIPTWTDISAYAVNDYQSISDLPRSINHKNTFISAMQSQIRAKYPSVSTTVRVNKENSAATMAAYKSTESNASEFVFSAGHGTYGGVWLYDGFVPAGARKFGSSYTRWVIMDACLALNETKGWNNITPWFDGVHAILGNRAIGWQFHHNTCFIVCWDDKYSESEYNNFASKFIGEGKTIGDSYLEAVGEVIYGQGGLGIEPAIAYTIGTADNGQALNMYNERYQNTYNNPFNSAYGGNVTAFWLNWRTFGTPSY